MKVTGKATIRNRFDIVCRDVKTGKETKYQAHNIVLDAMWSRLVNFQSFFDYIHFGTGTGTLSPARTSLFNWSGGKAATTVESVRALPTSRRMGQIVLQPEEYVGHELTEVGVAYGSSSSNLVTHAFIEDSEGNPISIVKTDTMVVTIYATIFFELGELTSMYGGQWRWVMPLASNDLLSYLMGASYPTQAFRVTAAPDFSNGTAPASHGASSSIPISNWAKDAANKRATTPVMRLGINNGNGAIRGFGLGRPNLDRFEGTFRGHFPISGVFTGHAIEDESVGVGDGETTGFDPDWDMISNATVYVDGAAVDPGDITIREGWPGVNVNFALTNVRLEGAWEEKGEADPFEILLGKRVRPWDTGYSYLYAEIPAELAPEVTDFLIDADSGINGIALHSRATEQDEWEEVFSVVPGAGMNTIPVAIPDGHVLLRWRFSATSQYSHISDFALIRAEDKHIFEFATPPAAGAVITADYTVPYIPKDENHVLDLQCSIQWGEG